MKNIKKERIVINNELFISAICYENMKRRKIIFF